jgi:hypothetical protein
VGLIEGTHPMSSRSEDNPSVSAEYLANKCKTLQLKHCQCFAFFIDARRSRQKQGFLVKSDTKNRLISAATSFAPLCPILHNLDYCILLNLQHIKKVGYAKNYASSFQFPL